MTAFRKFPALALPVLWAAALAAEAPKDAPAPAPLEVEERTDAGKGVTVARLSNGLTILVKPVRTSPVVCVQAYVRAGSIYEGPWLGCGLSHLLEHLVARDASHDGEQGGQESADQPSKKRDRIDEIGGQSNAYTSMDHTCYYISASSGKADECIDLIADWMARPSITPEDFQREHGVVQRELEMRKDDPDRQMWDMHSTNLYGTHPASLPVIGLAEPLRKITREDVLAYHRRMYVPQNMVFCVVGDVDAEAALDRCRRAFAGFEPQRPPDLRLPKVPPVASSRRVVRLNPDVKDVIVNLSFQTIPLIHEDLYPLDVLSYVLSNGQSSRLVRELKRERKLVTSISTSSWTPEWGQGAFNVSLRAEPDKADAAERAVLDCLRAVIDRGVEADELARAKRQKVADLVYDQQTVDSIASTLASDYLSAGDVNFSATYTRRIQDVTAEQVLQVARKYLRFDRSVVSRLEPASPAATQPSSEAAAGTTQAVAFRLPNGLRVVLQPNDAVGLVSLAFVTAGGLLAETDQTNGLGVLMAPLATKGAANRTAEQIAEFFDRAGGHLGGSCGSNSFYWQATVLDDSFSPALEILADVVQRPTFPAKELDILRPACLAAIRQTNEDWFQELMTFFRGRFFAGAPYSLLPTGSEKVVSAATVEQLTAFHRKHVKAGGSVLAVYGNFDAAAARTSIEKLFADLPAGQADLPEVPAPRVEAKNPPCVLKTQKQVAGVIVAVPGMKVTNLEDRLPMAVLDTILSGYQLPSGWLHTELRGKQLVYAVHSTNWTGLAPGTFMTYAACQPDQVPTVLEIIERNLRKAAAYTPTQDEIDQAVNVILTAELLDGQAMTDLAFSSALDELYGFGYDFRKKLEPLYRKITPADVARVAKKYLSGTYFVAVTTPAPEQAAGPGSKGP